MTEFMLIQGEDGNPIGVVDIDQIRDAAQILAYAAAAVAEDGAAVDATCAEWVQCFKPDEVPFVLLAALEIVTKMVVGPLVSALETVAPELRTREQLREAAAWAEATLGGGR
ncbi:hypothetical protein [Nocardia sp. CA-120079]|uniref:hypothetical protein n=1 Tax=Nocardia sp. CA-120079 TaxID=3239974 RepID=UPI003D96433A